MIPVSTDPRLCEASFQLHAACRAGRVQSVERLLALGANPLDLNEKGWNAFEEALEAEHLELCRLFWNQGLSVHQQTHKGETAVHIAVHRRERALLSTLKELGADLNAADFQGQSPLHIAVNLGMHEMVQELIIQGAHLDPLDNEEATPLMYALQLGRVGIAALLVRSGASLQRQRSDGASPLHLCLHSLHRHMQRAEESAKSWTSLHILVLTLIACEAPLNIQDQRGDTPLHLCGRLPYGKSLLWLVMLKSGARTGVRNMDGEAPYFSFNHQRLDKMRESAEQDAARCLSVIGAPYFMPKALGKWMYCRVARKLEKHGLVNRLLAYSKVHGLKAGDDVTELLDPR